MTDPKELDDPQLFDDPSYLMIPSYSMIPSHLMILSYSMINWKYGLWQSNSLRWYLHRWWSCLQSDSDLDSIVMAFWQQGQAAQLGELRQPDRCIFIWVQYIWYLIRNSCNVSFVNTGFRSFSSTNQIAFFAFSFHLQKNWQQWGRKLPLLSTSVVETVPLIALFWPAMLVKGPLLE